MNGARAFILRFTARWQLGALAGFVLTVAGMAAPLRAGADPAEIRPGASLVLDVVLVNDPAFAPVSEQDAQAILAEAQATVAAKLGFAGLSFRLRGAKTNTDFLNEHAPVGDACMRSFEATRVRPGVRRAQDVPALMAQQFLSKWKVEELRAFFAEPDRKALTDYAAIAQKLLVEFDRKVELISKFKLKDGSSLLAPDKIDERSYVRWVCAMRHQDEADLVLTNAFILYDLASEPYPHSIFAKCKVGGASLQSPLRRAMRGRAMVSSTFSMTTDLSFFQEEGIETLRPKERFEVIGAFIVAHELGHALFKLPDFYDHPKECLMTTKFETGYVSGYWFLKAYPGACSACQPWVAAKSRVFRADEDREKGDVVAAIAELQEAIRATPTHIDGSYKRYIGDLSYEVAELNVGRGDLAEARRWLKAVLRIVPDHLAARTLLDNLGAGNAVKNQDNQSRLR